MTQPLVQRCECCGRYAVATGSDLCARCQAAPSIPCPHGQTEDCRLGHRMVPAVLVKDAWEPAPDAACEDCQRVLDARAAASDQRDAAHWENYYERSAYEADCDRMKGGF